MLFYFLCDPISQSCPLYIRFDYKIKIDTIETITFTIIYMGLVKISNYSNDMKQIQSNPEVSAWSMLCVHFLLSVSLTVTNLTGELTLTNVTSIKPYVMLFQQQVNQLAQQNLLHKAPAFRIRLFAKNAKCIVLEIQHVVHLYRLYQTLLYIYCTAYVLCCCGKSEIACAPLIIHVLCFLTVLVIDVLKRHSTKAHTHARRHQRVPFRRHRRGSSEENTTC